MRVFLWSALAWLLVVSAAAKGTPEYREETAPIAREELSLVGWKDSCSAAVQYLGYPRIIGNARPSPVFARIGTLTLAPGATRQRIQWVYEADSAYTWKTDIAEKTVAAFKQEGYDRAGFSEPINTPLFDHPSVQILASTASLSGRTASGWPPNTYILNTVYYSPLGSCALTVFRLKASTEDYFQFLLVRIPDAGTRRKRASHHILYARDLLNKGEIEAALAETRVAASIAPDSAHARYNYAALLALTGRLQSALGELEAAVKIDSSYKNKAIKDIDFEELYNNDHFRFLTTGWKPPPPRY